MFLSFPLPYILDFQNHIFKISAIVLNFRRNPHTLHILHPDAELLKNIVHKIGGPSF